MLGFQSIANVLINYPDCGDPSDIIANNATLGEDSSCTLACPGDPTAICGAGNFITLYYWNGTFNVWNEPENTGYYEVRSSYYSIF